MIRTTFIVAVAAVVAIIVEAQDQQQTPKRVWFVDSNFNRQHIVRRAGDSLNLTCTAEYVDPESVRNSVLIGVRLQYDDYHAIYVAIPRASRFGDMPQFANNRARLLMNQTLPNTVPMRIVYTLLIDDLRPADTGHYDCNIGIQDTITPSALSRHVQPSMRLTVLSPPDFVRIKNINDGPYYVDAENSNSSKAKVMCDAANAWPGVALNWYFNHQLLTFSRNNNFCDGRFCVQITESSNASTYSRSKPNGYTYRWDHSTLTFPVEEGDRDAAITCRAVARITKTTAGEIVKSAFPEKQHATIRLSNVYSSPNSTSLSGQVISSVPFGPGARLLPSSSSATLMMPFETRVFVNETIKFECTVRGGFPEPVIRWQLVDSNHHLNNKNLTTDDDDNDTTTITTGIERVSISDPNLIVTSLQLRMDPSYHGQTLQCLAMNDATRRTKRPVIDSFTFYVYHAPAMVEISGPDEVSAGSVATFNCTTRNSYPQPQIAWQFNGRPVILPEASNNREEVKLQVFESASSPHEFDAVSTIRFFIGNNITNNGLSDIVTYNGGRSSVECIVYVEAIEPKLRRQKYLNVYRMPRRPTIRVSIDGSTPQSDFNEADLTAAAGKRVQFECVSSGGYPPPSIHWFDAGRNKSLANIQQPQTDAADSMNAGGRGGGGMIGAVTAVSDQRRAIVFDNITASMHQTRLECRVESVATSTRPSIIQTRGVMLNVAFPPAQVDITWPNDNQVRWPLNADIPLTCTTSPAFPRPHLVWRINGEPVTSRARVSEQFDVLTRTTVIKSEYVLAGARSLHQAQINCEVANTTTAASASALMASETLLVTLDPQPSDRPLPGLSTASVPIAERETGSHIGSAPHLRLLRFNQVSLKAMQRASGAGGGAEVGRSSIFIVDDANKMSTIVILIIISIIVVIAVCVVCICIARRARSCTSTGAAAAKTIAGSERNSRGSRASQQHVNAYYNGNKSPAFGFDAAAANSSDNNTGSKKRKNSSSANINAAGGVVQWSPHSSLSSSGARNRRSDVIAPINKNKHGRTNSSAGLKRMGSGAGNNNNSHYMFAGANGAGEIACDVISGARSAQPTTRRPTSSTATESHLSTTSSTASSTAAGAAAAANAGNTNEAKIILNAAVNEMQQPQLFYKPYETYSTNPLRSNYSTLMRAQQNANNNIISLSPQSVMPPYNLLLNAAEMMPSSTTGTSTIAFANGCDVVDTYAAPRRTMSTMQRRQQQQQQLQQQQQQQQLYHQQQQQLDTAGYLLPSYRIYAAENRNNNTDNAGVFDNSQYPIHMSAFEQQTTAAADAGSMYNNASNNVPPQSSYSVYTVNINDDNANENDVDLQPPATSTTFESHYGGGSGNGANTTTTHFLPIASSLARHHSNYPKINYSAAGQMSSGDAGNVVFGAEPVRVADDSSNNNINSSIQLHENLIATAARSNSSASPAAAGAAGANVMQTPTFNNNHARSYSMQRGEQQQRADAAAAAAEEDEEEERSAAIQQQQQQLSQCTINRLRVLPDNNSNNNGNNNSLPRMTKQQQQPIVVYHRDDDADNNLVRNSSVDEERGAAVSYQTINNNNLNKTSIVPPHQHHGMQKFQLHNGNNNSNNNSVEKQQYKVMVYARDEDGGEMRGDLV